MTESAKLGFNLVVKLVEDVTLKTSICSTHTRYIALTVYRQKCRLS